MSRHHTLRLVRAESRSPITSSNSKHRGDVSGNHQPQLASVTDLTNRYTVFCQGQNVKVEKEVRTEVHILKVREKEQCQD